MVYRRQICIKCMRMRRNMKPMRFGYEEICFISDDGVQVNVFFVDCHRIEESLEVIINKL
jgi:hypothetical protein